MLFIIKFAKKYRAYVAALVAVSTLSLIGGLGDMSGLLGANTLGIGSSHAPFDGTVYPYVQTVDWTALTDSERELSFDMIRDSKKSNPYNYDEKRLGIDFKELDFSSKESDEIRNEKITYSVPYMGTYKLDGKAGTGSHAAVDIKLLMRTPIVSVANGVVTDVQEKPSGFGKYVVVRHDNVPSVDNPNVMTTYFSSYSHLDGWNVAVGQEVKKGEQIGWSGNTGTSTTPHVHFQIDKADAPFHPYWPFTTADMQQAGVSFYEAINTGLGAENGRRYTVNPLDFVQSNLRFAGSEAGQSDDVLTPNIDTPEGDEGKVKPTNPFITSNNDNRDIVLKPDEETTKIVVEEDKDFKYENDLVFETPKTVLLGETVDIKAVVNNEYLLASNIEVQNAKIGTNLRSDLQYSSNFNGGENVVEFRPRELGRYVLEAEMDGQKYESEVIEVRLFNDLESDDVDIRILTALKKANILRGSEDNMLPNEQVNRAASLTFLVRTLEASKPAVFEKLNNNFEANFVDVNEDDWFGESVNKAIQLGSVDPNRQNFNPNRAVILPELLKMFFEAMNADIDGEINESYATYFDIEAWYAPYMQEALNRNIINTEDLEGFVEPMTRRDVAQISYKFLSLIETGRYIYE